MGLEATRELRELLARMKERAAAMGDPEMEKMTTEAIPLFMEASMPAPADRPKIAWNGNQMIVR